MHNGQFPCWVGGVQHYEHLVIALSVQHLVIAEHKSKFAPSNPTFNCQPCFSQRMENCRLVTSLPAWQTNILYIWGRGRSWGCCLWAERQKRAFKETQMNLSQRVSSGIQLIKIVKIKNRGAIEASELSSQLGLGWDALDLTSHALAKARPFGWGLQQIFWEKILSKNRSVQR